MQLLKSSTALAIRLMHELHRYRSDQLEVAAVSHFFVQAIEDAVGGPKKQRRRIAALVFRIDSFLLEALDDLVHQADLLNVPAAEQIQNSSAVKRFLQSLLPEIVRQIAKIEAGQEVNFLSKDQHPFDSPVLPVCSVQKTAELKIRMN